MRPSTRNIKTFTATALSILLITACSKSDDSITNPSQQQVFSDDTSLVADDAEMLANFLTTGRDSDDTQSFWACSLANAEKTVNFPARFWSNGEGFVGEEKASWRSTSKN